MGDDTPPALNYWLLGYAKEVKWYQEEGRKTAQILKAPSAAKAAAAPILIEPLLGDIKWGQGAPYNNRIRLTNPTTGKKDPCYTGCVATAMAMVLYYWSKRGRKRGCKATPAYTTTTKKYPVAALPSIAMFDYKHMTDAKPTTTVSKAAVAELMEYCGKAVYMDYTNSVSWALITKMMSGLKTLMNVPSERVECRYVTTPKFKARIIADLQAGCPVIMFGGGHCFVCDGYDSSTDLFHFNWGWNGLCNGWFAMTALNPDDKNYNASKNAIVGICPSILGDVNGDGKINMADVSASIKAQKEYDIAADVNFDGKVDGEDSQLIIGHILGGNTL